MTTITIDATAPTYVIALGMAGTGKSTLISALASLAVPNDNKSSPTVAAFSPLFVNLDPAVASLLYPVALDIRKTVNYAQLISEGKLGPNGAILTALNLFAAKADLFLTQLAETVAARAAEGRPVSHVIIDTPGQIEAFAWSASGTILSQLLSLAGPTCLLYLLDTPRCSSSPATFASAALYGVSIRLRLRLPLVLVLTKGDLEDSSTIMSYLVDPEELGNAVREHAVESSSYMGSLTTSLGLVLEKFLQLIDTVPDVSAATGENLEALLEAIGRQRAVYFAETLPRLQAQAAANAASRAASAADNQAAFDADQF